MKLCRTCGLEKPFTEFYAEGISRQTASKCKDCFKEKMKQHYWSDTSGARQRAATVRKKGREAILAFLAAYLNTHPCVDCGESDIIVLQFDHTDPGTKKAAIATLVASNVRLKHIEVEVAKCEVRCANCHTRKTSAQFGWWKQQLLTSSSVSQTILTQ